MALLPLKRWIPSSNRQSELSSREHKYVSRRGRLAFHELSVPGPTPSACASSGSSITNAEFIAHRLMPETDLSRIWACEDGRAGGPQCLSGDHGFRLRW
jgi:hypothetical protein